MEPGFRKIRICPYLPESMHELTCTYRSVRGKIRIEMKRERGTVQLKIEVPPSVQYEIDTTPIVFSGTKVCVQGQE